MGEEEEEEGEGEKEHNKRDGERKHKRDCERRELDAKLKRPPNSELEVRVAG